MKKTKKIGKRKMADGKNATCDKIERCDVVN